MYTHTHPKGGKLQQFSVQTMLGHSFMKWTKIQPTVLYIFVYNSVHSDGIYIPKQPIPEFFKIFNFIFICNLVKLHTRWLHWRCFPGGSVVKNLSAEAGDTGEVCSIPGLGRPPGEGNDNPLQDSCLENSMDRGAWRATVHGVAKSWTRLSTETTLQIDVHVEVHGQWKNN